MNVIGLLVVVTFIAAGIAFSANFCYGVYRDAQKYRAEQINNKKEIN